ncbi:uncharacterized protein RHO25_002887 [Cercospora beticola]|uniref:Uncharacterized protein n=1 Tax=Cercospora beticola TaxID=122368 RepID=A0ABZ0NFF9_CERBT|nr:hypothetical protein RHO25_002887 [Cercospora beticola]
MSDNDSDVPECDCASESGLLSISETLDLCNISYSREATIAAFKEYFLFLTELYLDPEQIVFPPTEGWEEITITNLRPLGKTDEVIELLRHLPYIKPSGLCHDIAPHCHLADYSSIARTILSPETFFIKDQNPAEFYSAVTHGIWDNIPPHVIGLAIGRENAMFLDTHLGVIYWPGGNFHPAAVGYAMHPDAPFQAIRDESFDYAPEEEMWRNAGSGLKCGWGIEEFFEMLKFHFRELNFLPTSGRRVEDNFAVVREGEEHPNDDIYRAKKVAVEVFRQHGWPDMLVYQKDECMEAVARKVEELERQDPNIMLS